MANQVQVNNEFYDSYGEKWYTAYDDPVALLRAENDIKTKWILQRCKPLSNVLDVGCGAGFLTNELARKGYRVTGIDQSMESLKVAAHHDVTERVHYALADAYELPFNDSSFDVVTALDFLEHVENPLRVIQECSRVLKPGGKFFFHTFNRNLISWLLVIKAVELFIPNTPQNMHVLRLFIKPKELLTYCELAELKVEEMTGIRPVISSIPMVNILKGRVPKEMRFELTRSLKISYMGLASKF